MLLPPARRLAVVLLVTVAVVLAGCASDGPGAATTPDDTSAAPSVVVTTSILGDIAANVLVGADAPVEVLLPPGADPHGYSPSAADGVTLREADLVVAVGLGLEEALEDTLASAEADGVEVLRVGELVDPIAYDEVDDADEHDDADEGDHADEGGPDPHVWLDPLRVAEIGQHIAMAYAELAPGSAATVAAAADAYEAELVALDEELRAMVEPLPEGRRQLVTNHDALGYLAARYDLEVIATVLPGTSADVDVTAGGFTELVALLRETGVPAVFAETTASDRLARALADEVGDIEVVELYTGSLGEPGSPGGTVVGMLRTDIERIVAALG